MAIRTLNDVLQRYPAAVQSLARSARTFLLKTLPDALETIDGSAPVIGYGYGPGWRGLTCTLLLSQSGVTVGFAHGTALPDSEHFLGGRGKIRVFVQLRAAGDLRNAGLRRLV